MSTRSYSQEVIWIIGASSGIGAALARELAARGAILALSARRKEALETLTQSLGAGHQLFPLDVTHKEEVAATARAIHSSYGRIDRVIFMAAAYTPMKLSALDMAATKQMIEVNLLGAFHVVEGVLPILTQQGRGQLALCGSVAGYTGLPGGQPYSATKAGIINLAESLRAELPRSIDVKLISPGFVKSELTDKNEFNMPMIITAERAASAIADGLPGRGFEIHFPKLFTRVLKLLRALPYAISLRITPHFNA